MQVTAGALFKMMRTMIAVVSAAAVALFGVDTLHTCIAIRLTDAGLRWPIAAELEMGASPDSTCNGRTFLHAAVGSGRTDLVKLLISNHAHVDRRSRGGFTPLIAAAAMGNDAMIDLLLAAGADVKMRAVFLDESILLAPVHNGYAHTVKRLIAAGAFDPADSAPLLIEAAHERQFEILMLLLAAGAQPNARGPRSTTPLMWAAGFTDAAYVSQLLAYGADPMLKDDDGRTASDWARDAGHHELLRLLASAKRDERRMR